MVVRGVIITVGRQGNIEKEREGGIKIKKEEREVEKEEVKSDRDKTIENKDDFTINLQTPITLLYY